MRKKSNRIKLIEKLFTPLIRIIAKEKLLSPGKILRK